MVEKIVQKSLNFFTILIAGLGVILLLMSVFKSQIDCQTITAILGCIALSNFLNIIRMMYDNKTEQECITSEII